MTYTYDIKWDSALLEPILLFLLVVPLSFLLIAAFYFNYIRPFMEEREFIKIKIYHSGGNKRKFWIREMKRLYLRYIPFIGRFWR